jgi:hypothetical protein
MKSHSLLYFACGGLLLGFGLRYAATIPLEPPTHTADGEEITGLVSQADTSVIALIDPASCFECDALMPRLQSWGQAHTERFAIVLTRGASDEERIQMGLLRMQPAGTLFRSWAARALGRDYRPELLLLVDGRLVMREGYDPNGDVRSRIFDALFFARPGEAHPSLSEDETIRMEE